MDRQTRDAGGYHEDDLGDTRKGGQKQHRDENDQGCFADDGGFPELDDRIKHQYAHADPYPGKSVLHNGQIGKRLREKADSMENAMKKGAMMRSLADTAGGNVPGKEKIMLETYVQMRYFDRIIERANLRFMIMSSGQFELRRQKEASNRVSQSGLELSVIDHHNGSERSVKSLSGGESFMASLSLALGLSDEIQARSGGIQMDTMFIDEGFGTLDDEALEQALKALSDLAGEKRLIGIISHVEKLKARIDRQIVTTKDLTGRSHVSIIV